MNGEGTKLFVEISWFLIGVIPPQCGFGFQAGRLDFIGRFAEPVLNKCDLLLRVFGCSPVAQDDFKARHDFAITGAPSDPAQTTLRPQRMR